MYKIHYFDGLDIKVMRIKAKDKNEAYVWFFINYPYDIITIEEE